nr:hypothetical protein [Salinibacter altiplanensis]
MCPYRIASSESIPETRALSGSGRNSLLPIRRPEEVPGDPPPVGVLLERDRLPQGTSACRALYCPTTYSPSGAFGSEVVARTATRERDRRELRTGDCIRPCRIRALHCSALTFDLKKADDEDGSHGTAILEQ